MLLQLTLVSLEDNKLQTILDKMKQKDVTILMGDFNAKKDQTTEDMKKSWVHIELRKLTRMAKCLQILARSTH